MEGWYEMDIDKLMSSTADSFVFDDPAEPKPVTRSALSAYMLRWDQRVREMGGANEWRLTHEVRQDTDGLLTDWEWWQIVGTDLQGSAVIVTSDQGVLLERITYFKRNVT